MYISDGGIHVCYVRSSTEQIITHTHMPTQCDPSEATWQLINSIVLQGSNNVPRIMFLGGGCSLATEPLAALAGRFYKISMVIIKALDLWSS